MFLNLKHESLEVYKVARRLVIEVYKTSSKWPAEERYGIQGQVRRAVNSVKFNIAEGSTRKSNKDRCRFYEIARGSIVELDSDLNEFHYATFAEENFRVSETAFFIFFAHIVKGYAQSFVQEAQFT